MKIIISPAKKMNTDGDGIFGFDDFSTPVFINEAEKVLGTMKQMTYAELKSLWKCNDSIAELNFDRITHGNLSKAITPAIFAYDGIQYKNLSPNTLETESLEYLKIICAYFQVCTVCFRLLTRLFHTASRCRQSWV